MTDPGRVRFESLRFHLDENETKYQIFDHASVFDLFPLVHTNTFSDAFLRLSSTLKRLKTPLEALVWDAFLGTVFKIQKTFVFITLH